MKILRKVIRNIILEGHQNSIRHRLFYNGLEEIVGYSQDGVGRAMLDRISAKEVKDLYRRYADQNIFKERNLVHWVKEPKELMRWVGRSKDELSCGIYEGSAYSNEYGRFGLWVEGFVTLAVWDQDDALTGYQNQFKSNNPEKQSKLDHMAASSGKNKVPEFARNPKGIRGEDTPFWGHGPFILTDRDFKVGPEITPSSSTEALVDNWRCKGIVLDSIEDLEDNEKELANAAKAFGVPVYDYDFWGKLIDADGNIL